MKTVELRNFVKEQLEKLETGKIEKNKSVGGRLFDSYGKKLSDFPEGIVQHVKEFRIDNLNSWVEYLYRLISQWIQEALQEGLQEEGKVFRKKLNNYLSAHFLSEFITGISLALVPHIVNELPTAFDRDFAGFALANIMNRVNLKFFNAPLAAGDINYLYSILTEPFNHSVKKEQIQGIVKEAQEQFIEMKAAPDIVSKSRSAQELAQTLQEIKKQLSKQQFHLLIDSLFDSLMEYINTNSSNEDGWEKLANMVNLLAQRGEIGDEKSFPIENWLNADPKRMDKLRDKIIAHPNFLSFLPYYQKSNHQIAKYVIDTFSYIQKMQLICDDLISYIKTASDIQMIDRAVSQFNSFVEKNESRFGRPEKIKKQLERIQAIADSQKKLPEVMYTGLNSLTELLGQVVNDIDWSDSIKIIQRITDAALKRTGAISSDRNEINRYSAAIKSHAYVAILKIRLRNVKDKENIEIIKKESIKYLEYVLKGKSLDSSLKKYKIQVARLTLPFNELINEVMKDQKEFKSALLDKLLIMQESVTCAEIERRNQLKKEGPGADDILPLIVERYKKEILASGLDNEQLVKLKKITEDILEEGVGLDGKAYKIIMALTGCVAALTDVMDEKFIASGNQSLEELTTALQSAKNARKVYALSSVAKKSLLEEKIFPEPKQREEENQEGEERGNTKKETLIEKSFKMIDAVGRQKIEEFEKEFEKNITPYIEEFRLSLQSAKDENQVHELAISIKVHVKNKIISELQLEESQLNTDHFEKLFEKFDEAARNKILELAQETTKPLDKKNSMQFIKNSLLENHALYTIFEYICYSTAGLLAAKALLPAHIVTVIGQIGVESIKAIINNSNIIGIVSVSSAIAAGIGLFRKNSSSAQANDNQQNEKIFKEVVSIVNENFKQCKQNFHLETATYSKEITLDDYALKLLTYNTPLSTHSHSPASYLLKVIEIIETDQGDKQLGKMLAEKLKIGFGIESISTEELVAQLKQLAKNRMSLEIPKVREKFDIFMKAKQPLIQKIKPFLDTRKVEVRDFLGKLAAQESTTQKLQIIREALNAQSPIRLVLTAALNTACKTNSTAEIWAKMLDNNTSLELSSQNQAKASPSLN
jgi:hypothetical protein